MDKINSITISLFTIAIKREPQELFRQFDPKKRWEQITQDVKIFKDDEYPVKHGNIRNSR